MAGMTASEYRWLLPSAVTVDPDEPPARRSTRDWVIDSIAFVLSAGLAILITVDALSRSQDLVAAPSDTPPWLAWLDLVVSLAACVALWWRRRYPVALALCFVPLSALSAASALPVLIVIFTVAVHRPFVVAAPVVTLNVVVTFLYGLLRPDPVAGYWETMAWVLALAAVIVLWGMVVRGRRQLIVSLRDRARRAESEQQLRVAQAQQLERARIAREMHDVLAHRISLLSLHAGALEIRQDASPAEVAKAAGVIRASAHQALQDLREVIGVLRENPGDDDAPERPQPTMADLSALVEESRAAGVRVAFTERADGTPPDAVGRTAYRIVQEGLTNARKHAPGALVTVDVAGAAGDGLTITVSNPGPVGPAVIPGTGTGLVGLAERATLAGGRLTHRREPGGGFTLEAWLPWTA